MIGDQRARHAVTPSRPAADRRDAHPEWCVRGHRCTARIGGLDEHASEPEAWRTDVGKIIATRYRRGDGTRDRIEIRIVLDLDPDDEASAQQAARVALATIYHALRKS